MMLWCGVACIVVLLYEVPCFLVFLFSCLTFSSTKYTLSTTIFRHSVFFLHRFTLYSIFSRDSYVALCIPQCIKGRDDMKEMSE